MFNFIKMYWRQQAAAEPGCEGALFVELNGLKWGEERGEGMLSQVHNIYQTNPADLKRICLSILCFNTVNQWEIITQSSCREEIEK